MTIEEAIKNIENDIEVSCWATDIVIEELRRLQKENEELWREYWKNNICVEDSQDLLKEE